jgi:hypothetical protein
MDEDFLRDRALYIRSLADKADPFIRKRLLNLAAAYEKRAGAQPETLVRDIRKPPPRKLDERSGKPPIGTS